MEKDKAPRSLTPSEFEKILFGGHFRTITLPGNSPNFIIDGVEVEISTPPQTDESGEDLVQ